MSVAECKTIGLMSKPTIYMDYAATTPIKDEVLETMLPYLKEHYGNPSSLHAAGRVVKKALEQSGVTVRQLLQMPETSTVVFTSGATESNNLVIKGCAFGLRHKGRHIITTQIEHSAVLEPCQWLETQGFEVTYLPVDADGFVRSEDLKQALRPETILVSIIHGNNEIGTVQDIAALAQLVKAHGALFHTDAVQTLGKIPLNLSQVPIDLLSGSGHKIYGPKGSGILTLSQEAQEAIMPWFHGGGQQGAFRPGTENMAAAVGFAKALELMVSNSGETLARLQTLQERLIAGIQERVPTAKLNGPRDIQKRVPGNVNFSFAPLEGEALVLRLDLAGVQVSSGSACHSAQLEGSHVVRALGVSDAESKATLRFSLGIHTTPEEIDTVIEILPQVLERAGYFRSTQPLLQ
jgi:cysteine desulfurase